MWKPASQRLGNFALRQAPPAPDDFWLAGRTHRLVFHIGGPAHRTTRCRERARSARCDATAALAALAARPLAGAMQGRVLRPAATVGAECRYGAKCARPQCKFRHPAAAEARLEQYLADVAISPACRFGVKCARPQCRHLHAG